MSNFYSSELFKKTSLTQVILLSAFYLAFFFCLYTVGILGSTGGYDRVVVIAGDFVSFFGTPLELFHAVAYTYEKQGFILSLIKIPLYVVQLPGVLITHYLGLPPAFVAICLFSLQSFLLALSINIYIFFMFRILPNTIYMVMLSLVYCLNPYMASLTTNVNVVLSLVLFALFPPLFDLRLHLKGRLVRLGVDSIFLLSGVFMAINIASYLALFVIFVLHLFVYYSIEDFPERFLGNLLSVAFFFLAPLGLIGSAYLLGSIGLFNELKNNVDIGTLQGAVGMAKFFMLMPRWVLFSADPPLIPLWQNGYILPFSLVGIGLFLVSVLPLVGKADWLSPIRRRRPLILFCLMCIGIFLSKGIVPPFGFFYKLLNFVPFASTLFREPATKFIPLFMIPFMGLLSFAILSILKKDLCSAKESKCLFVSFPIELRALLVLFPLFAVVFFFSWPFLNGLYFVQDNGKIPNMVSVVPEEWAEAARMIRQRGDKALVYPAAATYQHYLYGKDGLHSVDFLGFNFPFLENGKSDYLVRIKRQKQFDEIYNKMKKSGSDFVFLNGKVPEIKDVYEMLCHGLLSNDFVNNVLRPSLKVNGINIIALRNDMDFTNYGYAKANSCNSMQDIEKVLSSGNGEVFGKLSNYCNMLRTDPLASEQCVDNIANNGDFVVKLIKVN